MYIRIAPVIDESTYAVALHELGHCLAPLGRVHHIAGSRAFVRTGLPATLRDARLLFDAERSAWDWARHYALEWTPLMEHIELLGMQSYHEYVRGCGALAGAQS